MQITIDTIVLCKAFKERDVLATYFVSACATQPDIQVVQDSERRILAEYDQNLDRDKGFQKWIKELHQKKRFTFFSGNLDARIRHELVARGFHEASDHVFVAVALHSECKIVSEDSDYGVGTSDRAQEHTDVLDYLLKLGLDVRDVAGATAWLPSQNGATPAKSVAYSQFPTR